MDLKINDLSLYEQDLGICQSISQSVSSLISCIANYLCATPFADSQEEHPATSTKVGQLSPSQSLLRSETSQYEGNLCWHHKGNMPEKPVAVSS